MKSFVLKIGVLLIAGLVFIMLITSYGGKEGELVMTKFSIEKGESAWEVASNLKKEGLIDGKIGFIIYIYKEGLQSDIKAGEYDLNSSLGSDEIVEIITRGETIEEETSVKVTFPEGWNIKEIAGRLKENNFSDEKFLELVSTPDNFSDDYSFVSDIPKGKNLEGYLFPDTYFFDSTLEDERDVIIKMLDNFDKKLSAEFRAEIERQGKTVYEILTMASILEEEVRDQEDRRVVSGIFWSRLESGQAFQSCATLAFILGENKKQYSYADTQVESPYNTYLYPGLPPGPISNPGLDAIEAAIYPTDTSYNYFLSNPETGETVFSRTLDEHNLNKVKNGL